MARQSRAAELLQARGLAVLEVARIFSGI